MRRAFLGAASALVLALASSACSDAPPPVPAPPESAPAPLGDLSKPPADPSLGPVDGWYERYQAYMSIATRRDYLTTPEPDRFERFGLVLLDFQLREDLLREHQDELSRDEQDAYRRLPSADACREFIGRRAGRSAPRAEKDPLAPPPPDTAPLTTRSSAPPKKDRE